MNRHTPIPGTLPGRQAWIKTCLPDYCIVAICSWPTVSPFWRQSRVTLNCAISLPAVKQKNRPVLGS